MSLGNDDVIDRLLSHYRITGEIGAGGMGVVYRARDERLGRDVAIKVLPSGHLDDSVARRRFRQEALALAQLNHPNIATIHDFDSADGIDFLVMEYVEGEDLLDFVSKGPPTEREILRLASQLLDGLAAAHAQGVIHRDLKPGNIRVTADGRLKILDFGLAKLLQQPAGWDDTVTRSATGPTIVGTLPYMAPDQLRGAAPDERTDVYGAGAILYEVATGRRPHCADTAPALLGAILNEEPPAPRALNPRLSPNFERVLLHALDKEPSQRYQSVREFAAALEGAGDVRNPGVRPRRFPIRRPALVAGAILLLAILGVVLGRALLTSQSNSIHSIAVLPFLNETGDPEYEYLSDGLVEGLIYSLSEVPGIQKVIARSSVFTYKGREADPIETGKRLAVAAILQGHLERSGAGFLLSVDLVDTRDGRLLWGNRYARTEIDLPRLERDLVGDLASRLGVRIDPGRLARVGDRAPSGESAYRLYLKGRYHWHQFTKVDLEKALEYFRQAVDADPGYALAYVGMADTYYQMSSILMPAEEAMPRARAAAERAIQLDPNVAEAHAALACVHGQYDWAWSKAETGYKRAIDLNPNYSTAYHYYGMMLAVLGRQKEATATLARARDLDPLSPSIAVSATWPLHHAPIRERRYAASIAALEQLRAEYPEFPPVYINLIPTLVANGDVGRAVALADTAARIAQWGGLQGIRGAAYAHGGRKEDARLLLEQATRGLQDDPASYPSIVRILTALGKTDLAFEYIERALAAKNEEMLLLGVSSIYDPLRASPRFRDLLIRMGLPERLAEG